MLATFRAIFAGSERGKAFSIYGAMLGFASAVGLLLGCGSCPRPGTPPPGGRTCRAVLSMLLPRTAVSEEALTGS